MDRSIVRQRVSGPSHESQTLYQPPDTIPTALVGESRLLELISTEAPSLLHCGQRVVSIGVSKLKEQHEETQVTETVK
jgi:hypothetical protein